MVPRIGKCVDIVIGPPFSADDLSAPPNTKETWQKIAELARPAGGG